MIEELPRYALIGWAIMWLGGYVCHKFLAPQASDLRPPPLIPILFGAPRTNGTLNAGGVYGQLFAFLWVAFIASLMLRVDLGGSIVVFVVGIAVLSGWFFWRIRHDR